MLDNYPPGAANDPNAPYNQVEVPERDFDVLISQTLSKSTSVETNDYIPVSEREEDFNNSYCDTSDTDWKKVYSDYGRYTALELIEEFKKLLQENLPNLKEDPKKYRKYKNLIEECEGWVEDDIEIMEE